MKKLLTICATMLVAGTLSARADQTGLASIHDLRKEQAKMCMSDHTHYGNGYGATRKAAEAAAAGAWGSFVALEYGSDWAGFGNAGSRSQNCTNVNGMWNCEISGRPCLRRIGAVREASGRRNTAASRLRYAKKAQ